MGASLLSALLLLALAVVAAECHVQANDFCRRVEARTRGNKGGRCPSLPTAATDGIDAEALLGPWFEIAATARYKVQQQQHGGGGGACTRANLTAGGARGVLQMWAESAVVAPAVPAIGAVAEAAGVACASAAHVCRLVIGTHSKLAAAAIRVAAATAAAAASELPIAVPPSHSPASDTTTISYSSSTPSARAVAASLDAILHALSAFSSNSKSEFFSNLSNSNGSSADLARYLLDNLSRSLSTIASVSASFSSSPAPQQLLLRSLRASSSSASSDAASLSSLLVYNLTSVAEDIDQSLRRLGSNDRSTRLLLRQASTLLHRAIDDVVQQMGILEEQLASVEGPLGDLVAAEDAGNDANGRTWRSGKYNYLKGDSGVWRASSSSAVATTSTQIAVTRGKLFYRNRDDAEGEERVRFIRSGNNSNSSSSDEAWPWQILAVEGDVFDRMGDYSALLAYACSSSYSGEPGSAAPLLIDLLLLSRTPSLQPSSVARLLDTAASYAIFPDCDSPFVPTIQRSDVCASSV